MPEIKRQNVNTIHRAEQATAGLNMRIAVALTRGVGTMACAYCFALLAIIGFPGLLGPLVSEYVQWISQTFIQLTMLSVIMVGQGVLSRKQELQADAHYADIGHILTHLNEQDKVLLAIQAKLEGGNQ